MRPPGEARLNRHVAIDHDGQRIVRGRGARLVGSETQELKAFIWRGEHGDRRITWKKGSTRRHGAISGAAGLEKEYLSFLEVIAQLNCPGCGVEPVHGNM